jgi:hypothetical protein
LIVVVIAIVLEVGSVEIVDVISTGPASVIRVLLFSVTSGALIAPASRLEEVGRLGPGLRMPLALARIGLALTLNVARVLVA